MDINLAQSFKRGGPSPPPPPPGSSGAELLRGALGKGGGGLADPSSHRQPSAIQLADPHKRCPPSTHAPTLTISQELQDGNHSEAQLSKGEERPVEMA